MNYKEVYTTWLKSPKLDDKIKNELINMNDNEIKNSFHENLSFGTAGMRGIMGAGTNKLNIYIGSAEKE